MEFRRLGFVRHYPAKAGTLNTRSEHLLRISVSRWQRERNILSRVSTAADRNDDVLLTVEHVSHRRSALWSREKDRADLFARRLVVGSKHRAARMIRSSRHLRISHDDQSLGDHQPNRPVLSGLWNIHSFEQRVIPHHVRRVTVWDLPGDLALIQIDCGEKSVRRLEYRQPLNEGAALRSSRRRGRFASRRAFLCATLRRLRIISRASIPWPLTHSERLACPSEHVLDVRETFRRLYESDGNEAGI